MRENTIKHIEFLIEKYSCEGNYKDLIEIFKAIDPQVLKLNRKNILESIIDPAVFGPSELTISILEKYPEMMDEILIAILASSNPEKIRDIIKHFNLNYKKDIEHLQKEILDIIGEHGSLKNLFIMKEIGLIPSKLTEEDKEFIRECEWDYNWRDSTLKEKNNLKEMEKFFNE